MRWLKRCLLSSGAQRALARSWLCLSVTIAGGASLAGCHGTGSLFAPPPERFVAPSYEGPAVVIAGLRPCPPERAYERPLIVEARDSEDAVVARTVFSGLTDGEPDVAVVLFPPRRFTGRLRVRIGECGPLLDARAGALCEEPTEVRAFDVRIPENEARWRSVHDVALRRSRCLHARETR